jgi:signal transduction histidine kinase
VILRLPFRGFRSRQRPQRMAGLGLALVSVLGVGLLDLATGSDVSFAALYVLVIVGATVWAGFGPGLVVGIWSAVVWEVADHLVGRTDASLGVEVWNTLVRSFVHGVVVLLVAALVDALGAAEASEASSRSFLAAAAHQLRTPVAALTASVEALLLEEVSPGQETLLMNVAGEASRLGRLVASLLRTARLDQGETARREPVAVVRLCEDELDHVRRLSSVEWCLTVEPGVRSPVVVDPEATRESLANLLDNARRHALQRAELGVRVIDDQLQFRVTDDGPGLPDGTEIVAFERFVTLDGHGGTGLGLAIARDLARRQQGDVIYDRGAFVLLLPLIREAGSREGPQPETEGRST